MTDENGAAEPGSDFGRGLPQALARVESGRNHYLYVMRENRHWLDATRPDFWRADQVARNLHAGDKIEVHSADRQIQFEILILASNPYANPAPRLDMGFKPLWPADLRLPEPVITAASHYRVRPQVTHAGMFEIVDRTGRVVADEIATREAAMTTADTLSRSADDASIARAVAELAIAQATAPPVIPRARKGDPDQADRPKPDGRTIFNVGAHR